MLTGLAAGCDSSKAKPDSSVAESTAKDASKKSEGDAKADPAHKTAPAKADDEAKAPADGEPPEADDETKPPANGEPPEANAAPDAADADEPDEGPDEGPFPPPKGWSTDLDPNYLVWEQLPGDPNKPPRYRTTWLVGGKSAGEAAGLFLGDVDRLLLAEGDYVYEWQAQTFRAKSESCGWSPGQKEIPQFETFDDPRSRFLVTSTYEAPFPVHGSLAAPTEGVENFSRTMEITGNIGRYVFTKEYLYTMECDSANGWTEAAAKIIDLHTRSTVDLLRPLNDGSFAAIEAPLIAALEKKDPEGEFSRPSGPGDVVVAALRPAFGREHMTVEQQLAVETCHACQDGEWEDSTISVYLPFSTPKIAVKDLKVPPIVNLHYLNYDESRPHGFTELKTAKAKETIREFFRAKAAVEAMDAK
ncbi:MAG: hypothetical protein AAF799_42780 [Myxococcota bacterium]